MADNIEDDLSDANVWPVDENLLGDYPFSPGDIFWKRHGQKDLLLVRAGEPIDPDRLQKYFTGDKELYCKRIIHKSEIEFASKMFLDLQAVECERDKLIVRKRLLFWLKECLIIRSRNISLMDLLEIGRKVFFYIDKDDLAQMQKFDCDLLARSYLIAGLAPWLSLAMGYMQFTFLRDIYHLSLIMDWDLCENGLRYDMAEALKFDRISSFSHSTFQDQSKELFNTHPANSRARAKDKFYNFIHHKDLFILLEKHHEKINGTGFPAGIHVDEMSDLEQILVFLSHEIPYQDIKFEEDDATEFFNKFKNDQMSQNLSLRLKNMFFHVLEKVEEISEDEEEKVKAA